MESVHAACTVRTWGLYSPYMWLVQSVHVACTNSTCGIYCNRLWSLRFREEARGCFGKTVLLVKTISLKF